MLTRIRRAWQTVKDKRSQPLHIEFNVTDYCNLNCKGCSHYSPVAQEVYEPLHQLEADMKHISRVKNSELIEGVYLIGGETLLYPWLTDAMKLARMYFPSKKISVFTNGILLPRMSEEFWDTCREMDCTIALTRYPLKLDYDRLEEECRRRGVKVEVFGDRGTQGSFFKLPLDPSKRQKGWVSHFRCIAFGCITVDNGKIFPCSQSACVGHLNKRFGTSFKWEKGDYIEVKDLNDAKQILKLRNRPVPFCKYCKHQTVTDYGPSKRTVDEWT